MSYYIIRIGYFNLAKQNLSADTNKLLLCEYPKKKKDHKVDFRVQTQEN